MKISKKKKKKNPKEQAKNNTYSFPLIKESTGQKCPFVHLIAQLLYSA